MQRNNKVTNSHQPTSYKTCHEKQGSPTQHHKKKTCHEFVNKVAAHFNKLNGFRKIVRIHMTCDIPLHHPSKQLDSLDREMVAWVFRQYCVVTTNWARLYFAPCSLSALMCSWWSSPPRVT